MASFPVLLNLIYRSRLLKTLDFRRESAVLASCASGIAIVLLFCFCLGAFLVFAGQGERYGGMKQQRYMLKIASEDLAKYGYVTNISGPAVAL